MGHDTALFSQSAGDLPPEVAACRNDASRRVGQFLLISETGRGAWKAWDIRLARWVGIRFLTREEDAQRERWLRRARTAVRISHPGLVEVYEIGEHDGRAYIVTQHVHGRPLADLRPTPREAAEAVAAAAEALDTAHRQQVFHLELRPDSILVDASGRAYVADLGLPPGAGPDARTAAPEQRSGQWRNADARSDVHALGAILQELLAGGATGDLKSICARATDPVRTRRYASAGELAADLRRHLDGQPIPASRARAERLGRQARGRRRF